MGSQQGEAASAGREAAVDGSGAHLVFVPLMLKGHLIPAVDTAMLLASHGALCSIVGTPATATRVRRTIESAQDAGLRVRLVEFPLDHASSGFPEGADSDDMIAGHLMESYFTACALLRDPIERHLRAHSPFPTCVVSDFCHPWTTELAAGLGVPRVTFFSMCAFTLLCQHNVERFNAYDGVGDANEPVVVPGLDDDDDKSKRVVMVTQAQAPGFFRGIPVPWWEEFADSVERARAEADGVIINSFLEMEPEFVAGYAAARKMKVWTVGPVSLYHKGVATLATRGNATALDADECLRWLDHKAPRSVVYVSFGSIAHADPKQVVELGLGLEASGYPFIWVVRTNEHDEFLRGLEARTEGRSLVVREWAPQALILSHAAVGAFVTHCGWNSTLEAFAAGLPVVTWPHFQDQFLNEKMAVEVLRVGVSVGVTEPLAYQAVGKEVVVGRDVVEDAVRSVMHGGEEGEERRRRARVLADMATAAVREGGSSHANLLDLLKRFGMGATPTRDAHAAE